MWPTGRYKGLSFHVINLNKHTQAHRHTHTHTYNHSHTCLCGRSEATFAICTIRTFMCCYYIWLSPSLGLTALIHSLSHHLCWFLTKLLLILVWCFTYQHAREIPFALQPCLRLCSSPPASPLTSPQEHYMSHRTLFCSAYHTCLCNTGSKSLFFPPTDKLSAQYLTIYTSGMSL